MKRMISLLTAVLLVVGLLAFGVSAEDTVTVDIGSETVTFRVIDDFAGVDYVMVGWEQWGTDTVRDGKMVIEAPTHFFDCYDLRTAGIENADWSGMSCIVFEVTNESDGDLLFAFQPIDEFRCNLRNSKVLSERYPVKLYNVGKNELTDAKWAGVGALNGRDGFTIPWKFSGYIIMSIDNLALDGELTQPGMADDAGITNYGFHVMPDDATFVNMTVTCVYACARMPGAGASEVPTDAQTEIGTEAPTELPTEAPTAAPTEAPAAAPTEAPTAAPTEAPTAAPAETEAGTPADGTEVGETAGDGSEAEGGCASAVAVGSSFALVFTAVAAAAAGRKREYAD